MSVALLAKSLSFDFPHGLSAPNRIVYVLSRSGGNGCYSTVRLRTGLEHREFAEAIDQLERDKKILLETIERNGERKFAAPQKISLKGF